MPWLGDGTWVDNPGLARAIVQGRTNYRPWSGNLATATPRERRMNEKEKAKKWDELVVKSENGDNIVDIEGQKWLRMHPDVEVWADMNKDMIEWMTENTNKNRPPRSDCG